jgi:mono/diheme cytochrome c family protein
MSEAVMRSLFALSLLVLSACGAEEPAKPVAPAEPAKPVEPAKPAEPPAPAKPAEIDPATFAAMPDDEKKATLMKIGESVYTTGGSTGPACVTCHQPTGAGLPPSVPPLAGSKDNMGDCATHAKIVINGLSGPIEVQGVKYDGVMPPQGNLTNMEIAAVITYERNSWGNDYGVCLPADVVAARG